MPSFLDSLANRTIFVNDLYSKFNKALSMMYATHNYTIITETNTRRILGNVGVKILDDGSSGSSLPPFCNPYSPGTRTFFNAIPDATAIFYPTNIAVMSTSDLSSSPTASEIVTVVRNYMTQYCRVRLHAVYDPAGMHQRRSAFLRTNANHPSNASILNAVGIAATNNGLYSGNMTAVKINGFINTCVNLWHNYCVNSPRLVTAPSAYCHGNHCNHSNHGSRGRR